MYVGLSKGNPYKKYVCEKYVGEVQGDTYAHACKQRGNFFELQLLSRNGIANGAMRYPCANSRGSGFYHGGYFFFFSHFILFPFFFSSYFIFPFPLSFPFYPLPVFLPFYDWKPYFARPIMF